MRFTVALVANALLFTLPGAAQERIAPPVTRFVTTLTAIGTPQRNATLILTLDVKANEPSPQTRVSFQLPPRVRLVGGSPAWSGSLARGDRRTFMVRVQVGDTGVFRIGGQVTDPTPLPLAVVDRTALAGLYVVSGLTRGFIATDIDERFVPPGRRVINQLLARPEDIPASGQSVTSGRQVYGSSVGIKTRTGRLMQALHDIDALGVEGLLADSVAQVKMIQGALMEDQREDGSALPPQRMQCLEDCGGGGGGVPPPPPPPSSSECPAGYVIRDGYVEFQDNNGVMQRLPNVLIEAASAPHTFARLWTQWRSKPDGSFHACVPYSSQGWTFLTVFQDIGPVYVMRDGADPPGTFPQWYDAAWDLNQSPYLPVNTHHPEVSFALLSWYRAVTESYNQFTARRSPVRSWYYANTDGDYYCPSGPEPEFIGNCTKSGENIYIHRYAAGGYDNIWTAYGQFGKAHEYGHAWDHEIIGEIQGSCDGSHSFGQPNTIGCAIKEGWADFFSVLTLPTAGYFIAEPYRGVTPRDEGAVASYFFDLVDNASRPWARTQYPDDDEVSVSPDYLVQVLRDGHTNYMYPPTDIQSVIEVIDVVDDVTPIPTKPEFAGLTQPTQIVDRVARPSNLSIAQNRQLWLFDLFNATESPNPLVVTAGVPEYVSVKGTYALNGSASGGAGGYTGWLWERCDDCNGVGYGWWSDQQNTAFVAYAGAYTVYWHLRGRDRNGASDDDFATTRVCIPSTSCTANPASDVVPSRLVSQESRPATTWAGFHFGAGPWISAETDTTAVEIYSLAGSHYGWSPLRTWPNSFARPLRAPLQHDIMLASRPASLVETLYELGPSARLVRLDASRLTPGAQYRISFALDPDLGVKPEDDRMSVVGFGDVVVVTDPSGEAVAYAWVQSDGMTVRMYSDAAGMRIPLSPAEGYAEQRKETRADAAPEDIRFVMTNAPSLANTAGRIGLGLVAARGLTEAEAVANLQSVRAQAVAVLSETPVDRGVSAGRVSIRQRLVAAPEAAFGLMPSNGASAPAGGEPAGIDVARLRLEGITAVDISVPDGDALPVRITVLDARGLPVRRLTEQALAPGQYVFRWDGMSDGGQRMAPGLYQVVIDAPGVRGKTRLVLTR